MSNQINFPKCFTAKQNKRHIPIKIVTKTSFRTFQASLTDSQKAICEDLGFKGRANQITLFYEDQGLAYIIAGLNDKPSLQDGAHIARYLQSHLSQNTLKSLSFSYDEQDIPDDVLAKISLGWGMACLRNDQNQREHYPKLILSKRIDKTEIVSLIEGLYITRSLINKPANELGPQEMVTIANLVASTTGGKIKTTQDKALLKDNFPMIYAVGDSSHRRPVLIDMRWPRKGAPKVTLVGKGVVFDTGGLDLKPPRFMRYMKKDMGGAAQVLGLAWALTKTKTPLDIRVLIPAVENAVSSHAFRPGDVINTRKGLSVEVTDTDAEGRLIVGDALTYACEDNPDYLFDFCTLTGAARVALGNQIGALFGARKETTQSLQDLSMLTEDPLWTLPLWEDYKNEMKSDVADMDNIGSGRAGAIHGGLFLEAFVEKDINWAHLDVYAWEDKGRSAFDKGGMDQGLRTVYAYLKEHAVNA